MSDKPLIILDQHFRQLEELFRPETFDALSTMCDIIGGQNWPMPRARIDQHLPEASFYIASRPRLTAGDLGSAPKLKAVIEVSGAFREGVDYDACFARGVELLSCAPGFRQSVAEMTLAMVLAGGRGLVAEHEAFRRGAEHWLDDRPETDFSLFGANVGFVGYGQIARETHRLMAPFAPKVLAYDPFLDDAGPDVTLCDLPELMDRAQVLIMTAVPTLENRGLLNADLIARLRPGALVAVISRAWCVDFDALVEAASSGRIRLATDVFPVEPVRHNDPLRDVPNTIFSPHRAAAVTGGRHLIGDMILSDITAILNGSAERRLGRAHPDTIESLITAQREVVGP